MENWDDADLDMRVLDQSTDTELQGLLRQHHELGEQMMDIENEVIAQRHENGSI